MWKATSSCIMSVRQSVCLSAWNSSALTGRIFFKFGICGFFENLSRKFKSDCNMTSIVGTLHEDLCTCVISRWILLRMRNVPERGCRENQNTILYSVIFFLKIVFYEIMRKNTVEADRPHMTVWCCAEKMRLIGWMTKVRIQAHIIFNTRCFSTATVVTRTHLNVTFIRTLPLLFFNRLSSCITWMR